MKIYVDEVPECEECPFYVRDMSNLTVLRELAESEESGEETEGTYHCWFTAKVVMSQYGSLQLVEKEVRECPFEKLPCIEAEGKCPNCKCEMCAEEGGVESGVMGKAAVSAFAVVGGKKMKVGTY